MKQIYAYSLFIVVLSSSLHAQTINFINNSAYVTFSSDNSNVFLDFSHDVTVSNSQNVVVRGKIYSDESVVIKPYQNYSIVIKPPEPCEMCMPQLDVNADPPGTVIKPKPGGSGKIYVPVAVLYPVPVHTNLTFDVSNYFVENYTIFDMYGISKITQNLTPTHNYTIDVSGLANGNYILKLNLGANIYATVQFIKN
ncbi:T9SS type A sorting domain-containing protein [Flavobacterium sp.]|uniref:T9SS type A sorting domain-containing protein n=1 Tax=Flavobacterium sp. TaxID=239 RepID=UPI00286AC446|nr:T9SS type A sorting domain-containing protein [Flavobacterium sp.]